MHRFTNIFKNWLAYAAIITLLCGIIYIVVQQNFRLNANDPQYQLTEDAANALNNGADPKSLIPATQTVEMAKSLAPFMIICDAAGNVVATNATLNGKTPEIPHGVITYIQKNGSDMASWQPQPGVRQAMVGELSGKKSFIVIAGRSLRKTEERIQLLGEQVLLGWFVSIIALFVVAFLQDEMARRWSKSIQMV